tara:strand:- start:3799 stop:4188 length:390 start_codon:yes stop_codon:yes gene_type:complete
MARSNCSASTHDVSSDNPLVYRVARVRARPRLPQRLFAPSRLAGRAADDDDDAVLVIIIGLAVIITLVVVVVAVVWARASRFNVPNAVPRPRARRRPRTYARTVAGVTLSSVWFHSSFVFKLIASVKPR